jgi:hypothetical protein
MAKKSSPATTAPSSLLPGFQHLIPSVAAAPLSAHVRPLFIPDLVQTLARNKQIDAKKREHAHPAFQKWAKDLKSGVLQQLSETQVEQDFNHVLLRGLGYKTQADVPTGQAWSLTPKWPVPGSGEVDAALGKFRFDESGTLMSEPLVMVELKGARVDLDRKMPTRNITPVQQVWSYLNASESAQWAIVSNYAEIRLYSRQKSSNHLHRILLTELDDADTFAEFYAVFHAESLLGTGMVAHNTGWLLSETGQRQEKVSDDLYREYAERRVELIQELRLRGVELDRAIEVAQRLLDRILFIAFAEDRGLLPDRNLLNRTAFVQIPGLTRWQAFQLLFRSIDRGDPLNGIPRYNGNLFKPDPILDDMGFALESEKWPQVFRTMGEFDYRNEVTVDILGRIFERSITDIEEIKAKSLDQHAATLADRRRKPGRRKEQGVYYTADYIVNYLVSAALDPLWDQTRSELAKEHGVDLETSALPSAGFLLAMLSWLDSVTLCDPACGSGAFLIAAYDWFLNHRLGLLDDLSHVEPVHEACAGARDDWIERSAPLILQKNLYGVDISPESVEIAQLSLWIRTARPGQPLTDLSAHIRCGNSVVDDPTVDSKAFDWKAQFPGMFERGGFDAVVGNPPYVRQELLSLLKPYLAQHYQAYHGMADLYVYFYERGVQLLKAGGRLAFVVTNKWMKAGYGEPLRRFFGEHTWVESVVDFGHAKQFFKDADVFPCFLVVRRPSEETKPDAATVSVVPRDLVRVDQLPALIQRHRIKVALNRLTDRPWSPEISEVGDLLQKVQNAGMPLSEIIRGKPYRGILTGFNEAFLIDSSTRQALIQGDPRALELVKPFLRGQDVDRWSPDWADLWMIAIASSADRRWPWTDAGEDAECRFRETYPSIHKHLNRFRPALERRLDKGRYWWELRACAYWGEFDRNKIVYQEIQYHPSFALDSERRLCNAKVFFLPADDPYVLAVLNSPLIWWHNWRYLPHMKDEALTPVAFLMDTLPVPEGTAATRSLISSTAQRLHEITRLGHDTTRTVLDWLLVQHSIAEPTTKLRQALSLSSDTFVAEVQKARGRKNSLTAAGLRSLREEYSRTIEPARVLASEALQLEYRIHDLVNEAYGLTRDEVRLMWDTAPPRMPVVRPAYT